MPSNSLADNGVQWILRREFLHELLTEAPQVNESLYALVGSASELYEAYHADACVQARESWPAEIEPPKEVAALWAWADRFHFVDSWILDAAVRSLREWQIFDLMKKKPPYPLRSEGPAYYGPLFKFETTWDPYWQGAATFRRRARKELDEFIRLHMGELLKEGYVPSPVVRERQHVLWTIRYQVLEKSFAEILPAGIDGGDRRRNVEKAVKRIAGLMGLTMRPRQKGRRLRRAKGQRSMTPEVAPIPAR